MGSLFFRNEKASGLCYDFHSPLQKSRDSARCNNTHAAAQWQCSPKQHEAMPAADDCCRSTHSTVLVPCGWHCATVIHDFAQSSGACIRSGVSSSSPAQRTALCTVKRYRSTDGAAYLLPGAANAHLPCDALSPKRIVREIHYSFLSA